MVAKKAGRKVKTGKKVKTLPTKALSPKKAGTVKGGDKSKGDIFAGIGDIKGESTGSDHKDWNWVTHS